MDNAQGIPQEIFDAPTTEVEIVGGIFRSPYGKEDRCACGAVIDNVDPKSLRAEYGRGKCVIVRCPSCCEALR